MLDSRLQGALPGSDLSSRKNIMGRLLSAAERWRGFCWLRSPYHFKRLYGESPNDGHRERCYTLHFAGSLAGPLEDGPGHFAAPLSWAALSTHLQRANLGASQGLCSSCPS